MTPLYRFSFFIYITLVFKNVTRMQREESSEGGGGGKKSFNEVFFEFFFGGGEGGRVFNIFVSFKTADFLICRVLLLLLVVCGEKPSRETVGSLSSLSQADAVLLHRFLGGWAVRGGVTGRPEFIPPYWYLAFFSEGFRIWKEHIRVSSTLIMPPALSNSPQ